MHGSRLLLDSGKIQHGFVLQTVALKMRPRASCSLSRLQRQQVRSADFASECRYSRCPTANAASTAAARVYRPTRWPDKEVAQTDCMHMVDREFEERVRRSDCSRVAGRFSFAHVTLVFAVRRLRPPPVSLCSRFTLTFSNSRLRPRRTSIYLSFLPAAHGRSAATRNTVFPHLRCSLFVDRVCTYGCGGISLLVPVRNSFALNSTPGSEFADRGNCVFRAPRAAASRVETACMQFSTPER